MHVGSVIANPPRCCGNVRPASVRRPIIHRYEITFAYDVPPARFLLKLDIRIVGIVSPAYNTPCHPYVARVNRKRLKVYRLVRYRY